MIIIAHNIRSMHNVGSIFRNAAAFGVERLYLTGITASPPRKEIAKVALGAQDLVDWESGKIDDVIFKLKASDYVVYGLEQSDESISLDDFQKRPELLTAPLGKGGDEDSPPFQGGVRGGSGRIALVLGNEVDGIDQEIVSKLDGLIEIPMGEKRSLNVAVASGIAMYELSREGRD